ncbi:MULTISPECIES: N-6 DNA methylase [unclassified Curtobacterium]|uniref:N-6 DNA methylase n=1 Tax=unclassified Curtobacterium TaxID=257496 RepID=UPI0039B04204
MATSIEPTIASWAEHQIRSLGWEHGPEQNGRDLDARVDESLRKAPTKSGGDGVNKPDHVIILDNGAVRIPVLCEWKGAKGAFRDKKKVALRDKDGYMRYGAKGIDRYATLGAAYYASRVVGPAGHSRALALAVNGYFAAESDSEPTYEVALYVVSKDDNESVFWVGDYKDLTFLKKANINALLEKIEDALDPEAAKTREATKAESLDEVLKRLNQFLHAEHSIVPSHRVNVVSALMIASLGVQDATGNLLVKPLIDDDLYGGSGNGSDGAIILSRVEDYLKQRTPRLPIDKQQSVLNALRPTLLDVSLSTKKTGGMSALKGAFHIVSNGLLPRYRDDRAIDFAGKLFNAMYAWIDVPDSGANDVVLTPKRTTDLMIELTQVNADSYVWDWTLGTGAFLVSAMNAMMGDARERLEGEDLAAKEDQIKSEQLLGIEKLASIYVLAVLNMILMGDGASNIIHGDSHLYDGMYQEREGFPREHFPATTLVLNPPYSAPGNGLIFVKEAFAMMNARRTGQYGAVLIQDSAGSGRAIDYCKEILKGSTLLASVKMPGDLFLGKSGVQTSIYLFKVGSPHPKDHLVKFIDFRNDGYKRFNRKKVKDPSVNLRAIDDPDGRYAEVAAIINGRKYDTCYYPLGELYFQDTVDPDKGNDWNFDQHIQIETKPELEDFLETVAHYLNWEIESRFKSDAVIEFTNETLSTDIDAVSVLSETEEAVLRDFDTKRFIDLPVGGDDGLFTLMNNPQLDQRNFTFNPEGEYPYFTRTVNNNGILGLVDFLNDKNLIPGNSLAVGMIAMRFFYMEHSFYAGQFTKTALPNKAVLNKLTAQYFITCLNRFQRLHQGMLVRDFGPSFNSSTIPIPVKADGAPDYEWMEIFITALQKVVNRRWAAEFASRVGTTRRILGQMS